jgi:hypothetical protein
VINLENAGKDRTQLSRAVVLALRTLLQKPAVDEESHDLAAFAVLALREIAKTIDASVLAWEKRGYWIKADRFRLDWAWSARISETMQVALMKEEWDVVALSAVQALQKLDSVKVPQRHRLGTPWVGAWNTLKSEQG